MRQDLLDAFNNILSNPELKSRFDKIKNTDDVYAVFKDAGYPGSSEELDNEIRSVVEDFVKSKNASDGDLSGVVGGKGAGFSKKLTASALALMGIASTASGNALHALHGSNFENSKTFAKKQAKNPVVRNILTHGAVATVVGLPIGALIWALMRNPKSPRLQKIYKYATRADKALTEFEKAFTPQPISELSDSAPSGNDINTAAHKKFREEINKIIEEMEKDKLFLGSWKNVKYKVQMGIDRKNLDVERAYHKVATVFFCVDIGSNLRYDLRKYIGCPKPWNFSWKKFYSNLSFVFNNTDMKKSYVIKRKKEVYEYIFKVYDLSSDRIDNLLVKDLFCKTGVNNIGQTRGDLTNDSQAVQDTNNAPILASVYIAMQHHDPEGTYNAFIEILSKMGIAKKYKGGTYDNINRVFSWINSLIVDDRFRNGFKDLYSFLVKENGNKNQGLIDLIKGLVQTGEIKCKNICEIESQIKNFWGGSEFSHWYKFDVAGNFVRQLSKINNIFWCRDTSKTCGVTEDHLQNYTTWKNFHEAKDNVAKLQVLSNKILILKEYQIWEQFHEVKGDVAGSQALSNFSYVWSSIISMITQALNSASDFDQAVKQSISATKIKAQEQPRVLELIEFFEKFFNIIKKDNISLSDIGIDQGALDVFD